MAARPRVETVFADHLASNVFPCLAAKTAHARNQVTHVVAGDIRCGMDDARVAQAIQAFGARRKPEHVFHSLLIGKRTAVVAPWETGDPLPIRSEPSVTAGITAYLQPKVVAIVATCENGWCRLTDPRFKGWIEQDRLWGVYPDETID